MFNTVKEAVLKPLRDPSKGKYDVNSGTVSSRPEKRPMYPLAAWQSDSLRHVRCCSILIRLVLR